MPMTITVPQDLTPELAMIFRITHIWNVAWILDHGLHCDSSGIRDPDFVPIGGGDLVPKRKTRAVPVPPGGVLADYIPLYFIPRTPMLYSITAGGGVGVVQRPKAEIAVLVTSLPALSRHSIQFVFTDRHAMLATARFSSDPRSAADRPSDPRLNEKACSERFGLVKRHESIDARSATPPPRASWLPSRPTSYSASVSSGATTHASPCPATSRASTIHPALDYRSPAEHGRMLSEKRYALAPVSP